METGVGTGPAVIFHVFRFLGRCQFRFLARVEADDNYLECFRNVTGQPAQAIDEAV